MTNDRLAASQVTRTVKVDSPYGRADNGFDTVERVVDTIAVMLARRQIDARQESAARKVQAAYEMAPASYRCALAAGEGGGLSTNASPSERQLWAGGVLNEARGLLGERDTKVVLLVCGQGFSIEQVARSMFVNVREGRPVPRAALEDAGRMLRWALTALADHWFPEKRGMRTARGADAVPGGDPAQRPGKSGQRVIDTDVVAHVAHRRR